MKKYRTTKYGIEIEEVEVTRETDISVFTIGHTGKECRAAKVNDHERYHDTWSAAHDYLTERERKNVESLQERLWRAEANYSEIMNQPHP